MNERIEVRRRTWAWDVQVRRDVDPSGLFEALGEAMGEHPIAGLAFVTGGLVLVVALPFLLLAVEVAVLLVATAAVIGSRVVLRRPWLVEARYRRSSAVIGHWQVRGFRRAGVARDQIRHLLSTGHRLPPFGPYDPDDPPPPRPMGGPLGQPEPTEADQGSSVGEPTWPSSEEGTW